MEDINQHIKPLLTGCNKGDQNAQFELYKMYYKAMYNTAYRILNDSYEAEDVMQEAFLSAFTKLDTFKGEVTFGAWLKRIVINRSLTQLKRINRIDETSFEDVEYKMEVISDEDNRNHDYSELKAKEIVQTMQQLKESYRVALSLSLIEGYDNEEVAQIMKISDANCRTMISRAKSKLRELLSENTVVN
ncbi:MAG: RNA polymerase sigma factor [Bacteroidota bacterium]